MLQVAPSLVPSISISFSPNEINQVEIKPPFNVIVHKEPDSPRPFHLSPPSLPIQSIRKERHGQLSPLSSPSSSCGKGLERERFEAMLKASRERSAMLGAKKPLELRKEIAIRAQKAKQCERRARFLSKVLAPPSPTAADMPVTPPDSPAVFHFSLPSPGLVSPIELFEDLANHPELYDFKATIEQVDFRLPKQKQVTDAMSRRRILIGGNAPAKPLPSLDQISERLSRSSAPIIASRSPSPDHGRTTTSRLPSFLRSRTSSSCTAAEPSPIASSDVLRRHRPVPPVLVLPASAEPRSVRVQTHSPMSTVVPTSPRSPRSPRCAKLQITTTICPPTRSKSSPTKFTEENITKFGSAHSAVPDKAVARPVTPQSQIRTQRIQASRDLLDKLSRRTSGLPGAMACGVRAQDDISLMLAPSASAEDKQKRRKTAPAEMSAAQRGIRHAVLDKPGGF